MEGQVELFESAAFPNENVWSESHDSTDAYLAPGTLAAGQNIAIGGLRKGSPVVTLTARDLQRELSWQEGLHDFSNTPVGRKNVIRQ